MGYINIIGNNYPLTLCYMVIDCKQECGFSQLINFPTRRNNIQTFSLLRDPWLSENFTPYLALVIMKSYNYLESSTEVQLTKMPKHKILVWSRADINTIKSIARNFNTCLLEKHSMTNPVNILWDEFIDICQRYLDLIRTNQINCNWL